MALLPGARFDSLFLPRAGGGPPLALPAGPGLLFFFAADCPACPYAARAVARIAAALVPRGLAVVGISRSAPDETRAFAFREGLEGIDVGLDLSSGPVASTFELDGVPTAFLVEDGAVRACVEGWSRHDYNALAAAAADLVGAPPPTASDPSDGMPDFAFG
jgi:peroxiredoxin